ncbi:MAG: 50S ribosomal protein L23 [Acidobacteriia bacterium]|nr:50S ribosomal protein L23 [Terriglobia bacterium]
MNKSPYQILKKPVITEKSVDARERARTLCFQVDPHATKVEIREAVQILFKVKVDSVRTAIYHGKTRRRGRTVGRRPDWKKAFVKLQAGEKIPEVMETT